MLSVGLFVCLSVGLSVGPRFLIFQKKKKTMGAGDAFLRIQNLFFVLLIMTECEKSSENLDTLMKGHVLH